MDITAVIPVRKGSRRLKDKNCRSFAGSTLLEHKINQLKEIVDIKEIIVSTDSETMLEIAKRSGVTPKRRPDEYCDEKTKTFNEVVRYIASNEVTTTHMMWTPCVCPLVDSQKIREGIELYKGIINGELQADSIATACLIKEYLFDERGPVNFCVENHVPSQQLPNWHYITNGFFIARRLDMAKWGFVYGPNPYLCEVNKFEAIDIDDEYDFMMAENALYYLRSKHG